MTKTYYAGEWAFFQFLHEGRNYFQCFEERLGEILIPASFVNRVISDIESGASLRSAVSSLQVIGVKLVIKGW